jgi:hypothetical protein
MKIWGSGGIIPQFLTSILGTSFTPREIFPGTHCIGGRMGSSEEKFLPCWESNSGYPAHGPSLRYPDSPYNNDILNLNANLLLVYGHS